MVLKNLADLFNTVSSIKITDYAQRKLNVRTKKSNLEDGQVSPGLSLDIQSRTRAGVYYVTRHVYSNHATQSCHEIE